MQVKQQRNSSIELLRIAAMLFIVCSHLCFHNGMVVYSLPLTVNKIFAQCALLGNLGVDIFVIITGYFLCDKAFSTKRVSSLLAQVWFYSLLLSGVSIVLFGVQPSLLAVIETVFPTIFAEYWFFTAYIVLLFISPFVNCMIDNLSRPAFLRLVLILVALWVIMPTFTTQNMYGSEIPQFLLFYLIGAYFKRYPDNIFKRKAVRNFTMIASAAILILSVVAINVITMSIEALNKYSVYATYFFSRNSLFVVAVAVGMFSAAAYSTPFFSGKINTVSSCVFGVYLIHDHPLFRTVLWINWFDIKSLYESVLFPIYAILIVLVVFTGGVLVEFVRLKTVAKPMSNAIERLLQLIVMVCKKIIKE